jgi:hypothetical protein
MNISKKINSQYKLFEQKKHPSEIDEIYHIFSDANISNVFFWTRIFDSLSLDEVIFDSIVECGVGRGRSLLTLNQLLHIYQKTKLIDIKENGNPKKITVYGLDSFEGFPKPHKYDDSFRSPKEGEWSYSPSGKYKYDEEFIKSIFKKALVTQENLKLIKGFFDKTTSELKFKKLKIGLLHLDGDLYDSTKQPLMNLSEKVVNGGFIVFDDFILKSRNKDKFPGCRRAYEEFISNKKDKYIHFPSVRGNVILKRIK